VFCQVGIGKKKSRGLLVAYFYTTLNLEVGDNTYCHHLASLSYGLGEGALEPRGEQSQTISNLAYLNV
jgi:hypothetical protein